MELGEYIKQLRLAKGLTLEQVGDSVGVGKSTVRKWETGDIRNMKRDKIVKLAKVLGISPDAMLSFGESEETPPAPAEAVSDPTEQEVLEAFRQLSPEQQQLVLSLLETMK